MISRNSMIRLLVCTALFIPNGARANDSAKIPNVQTKNDVVDVSKTKPTSKDSQSYPLPNEAFRNDGKTPSCVSSPELSGAGDRKDAFPDLNSNINK